MNDLLSTAQEMLTEELGNLVDSLNNVATLQDVINRLAGGAMLGPLDVEPREGKYKGKKVPVKKILITSEGVSVWCEGEGTSVRVEGPISGR